MKTIEETIWHNVNNHEKINKLEEIDILNKVKSQNILNDVINGKNDPLYQYLLLINS